MPHAFKFLIECSSFHQTRQFASGANRKGDMRHFDAKDVIKLAINTKTVDIFHLVPIHEGDDDVEDFFSTDGAHAEHGEDIDNADASDFHMVARGFGRGTNEIAAVGDADLGHIIGHETVAALQEGEDTFAFADATGSADQDADPLNVYHATVLACCRCKILLEEDGGSIDEPHRDHGAFEDGNVRSLSFLEQDFGWVK